MTTGWDAADWQAFFDERAGIAEYDGLLSRADAEQLAFEDCKGMGYEGSRHDFIYKREGTEVGDISGRR